MENHENLVKKSFNFTHKIIIDLFKRQERFGAKPQNLFLTKKNLSK
jgi:hypothetical protein